MAGCSDLNRYELLPNRSTVPASTNFFKPRARRFRSASLPAYPSRLWHVHVTQPPLSYQSISQSNGSPNRWMKSRLNGTPSSPGRGCRFRNSPRLEINSVMSISVMVVAFVPKAKTDSICWCRLRYYVAGAIKSLRFIPHTPQVLPDDAGAIPRTTSRLVGSTLLTEETAATRGVRS